MRNWFKNHFNNYDVKPLSKGFTLAELLIALVILGVIATFTIPKVLQSNQDTKKKAIFKETIGMLNDIVYNGWLTKELAHDGDDSANYIISHINALKICSTDTISEGCHTGPLIGGSGGHSGVVLHNGAVVTGLDGAPGYSSPYSIVVIDWNGSNEPNIEGDDQMILVIFFADGPKGGTVSAQSWLSATSATMYEAMFQ